MRNLQFVYPRITLVFVRSRSNWNLEILFFKERGKPEYPNKNLSEQGREPTTNLTHIWRRREPRGKHVYVGNDFPPP